MEDIKINKLSFLRGGSYNYGNGTLNNRGSDGLYWERRIGSGAFAYALLFNSGGLNSQTYYSSPKGIGLAIRCVVR